MTKTLKVIKPFFVMDEGDTFELSDNEQTYKSEVSSEYTEHDDEEADISSSYNASYTISKDYAEALIKDGYLKEVKEDNKYEAPFVNVFDEINELLEDYTEELKNVDESMADMPEVNKLEAKTVLTNMITLLTHLKSLKK